MDFRKLSSLVHLKLRRKLFYKITGEWFAYVTSSTFLRKYNTILLAVYIE
jgi:hypothetical protein